MKAIAFFLSCFFVFSCLLTMPWLMNKAEAVADDQSRIIHYRDLRSAVTKDPGPIAMGADILIARPLLLTATAMGTGLFVISLPLSLLGNNVDEACQQLIVVPARATFLRCLGCSISHSS